MKFHHRWAGTALVVIALSVSSLTHAAPVSGQGTWETTLQARDFDGNPATIEGYYDTVLNITWLADANYAGTAMNWATANSWAAGLNINGIAGWRLPTVSPVNGSSFNYFPFYNGSTDIGYNISAPGTVHAGSTASEMAHMFYVTLGDKAQYNTNGTPQAGYGLTNTGPFSNVQSGYWLAPEYAPDTANAWGFSLDGGLQLNANKTNMAPAWAVHPGSVGASVVPVPAAVWLFGSGLLGLIGVARRRK